MASNPPGSCMQWVLTRRGVHLVPEWNGGIQDPCWAPVVSRGLAEPQICEVQNNVLNLHSGARWACSALLGKFLNLSESPAQWQRGKDAKTYLPWLLTGL